MYRACAVSLIAIGISVTAACNPGESAPSSSGGPATSGLAIADFKLDLRTVANPKTEAACSAVVKPPDIGCTTLCKPCKTSVCQNGEWVRIDIATPELCKGRPGGTPPSACPRTPEGFCPAECHVCT